MILIVDLQTLLRVLRLPRNNPNHSQEVNNWKEIGGKSVFPFLFLSVAVAVLQYLTILSPSSF